MRCTSLADYFLICTGRSDTQVQAIAQSIDENLRPLGRKPRTVEGLRSGQWVLIDYGDVVVHVFLESVRAFYDLERLWARAADRHVAGAVSQPGARPAPRRRRALSPAVHP